MDGNSTLPQWTACIFNHTDAQNPVLGLTDSQSRCGPSSLPGGTPVHTLPGLQKGAVSKAVLGNSGHSGELTAYGPWSMWVGPLCPGKGAIRLFTPGHPRAAAQQAEWADGHSWDMGQRSGSRAELLTTMLS